MEFCAFLLTLTYIDGQFGMYGPPLRCKRKMTVTVWSAQMYPAFL